MIALWINWQLRKSLNYYVGPDFPVQSTIKYNLSKNIINLYPYWTPSYCPYTWARGTTNATLLFLCGTTTRKTHLIAPGPPLQAVQCHCRLGSLIILMVKTFKEFLKPTTFLSYLDTHQIHLHHFHRQPNPIVTQTSHSAFGLELTPIFLSSTQMFWE